MGARQSVEQRVLEHARRSGELVRPRRRRSGIAHYGHQVSRPGRSAVQRSKLRVVMPSRRCSHRPRKSVDNGSYQSCHRCKIRAYRSSILEGYRSFNFSTYSASLACSADWRAAPRKGLRPSGVQAFRTHIPERGPVPPTGRPLFLLRILPQVQSHPPLPVPLRPLQGRRPALFPSRPEPASSQ